MGDIERLSQNSSVVAYKKSKCEGFKNHWHEYYEIICYFGVKGECIINNGRVELKGDCCTFLTPMDFHEIIITDNTKKEKSYQINISFMEDVFRENFIKRFDTPMLMNFGNDVFLKSVAERIVNMKDPCDGEKRIKLLEYLLLEIMTHGKKLSFGGSATYGKLRTAVGYILEHFNEDISLGSVAEYVGLSPSYLSQVFKNRLGMTFSRYLGDFRLRYATELLRTTEMSITEVCYCSGYRDLSHFLRSFSKKYGITPLKYRKKEAKNNDNEIEVQ